ncbi:MAG: hypothetical protein ACREN0_08625, partial [Thermodesulfobacteriota bacterium]
MKTLFSRIAVFLLIAFWVVVASAQTHTSPGTRVIINTTDAMVFHATDCTGLTAVEGVQCYEQDSKRVFMCVPSAGDCDTGGEWIQVGYCNITGCTSTGKQIFTT